MSSPLNLQILQEIKKHDGAIDFAAFMQLALYTPQLGYYSTEVPKLGPQGDFITAPEMTPLFAKCMASQFHQLLTAMGGGSILELGAGSGVFAKDVLTELKKLNALPDQYVIWEPSSGLRKQQEQLLNQAIPDLCDRITWLSEFPSAPMTGVIFANEVLDAMPVHLFQIDQDAIFERYVTEKAGELTWCLKPPSKLLEKKIKDLQTRLNLPKKYQSEINLNLENWFEGLSRLLVKGALILVDYGYGEKEYYHPDRDQGTLMCFSKHQKSLDPLHLPGKQDITAHVNFTEVAECATEKGFQFAGFTTQAAFLLALGLLTQAEKLTEPESEIYHQNQMIKRLTLPSEMGEIVKVIGFTKDLSLSWDGFNLFDRRQDL